MSDTNGGQPAGWYPDPEMADTVRYWNGAEWTDNRAPASGAASPVPATPATPLTTAADTPSSATGSKTKPILIAVGAIVLVAAIVVAAVASRGDDADGSASASDSELAGVYDKCVGFMNEVTKDDNGNSPVDAEDYMDLGSDSRSVTISAPESGDMQDLYATIALGCYLGKLKAPSGVSSLVEGTTAMMGRQTEEWDHYRLTWSYHPDTSLAATLEDTSD